uniref:non-specific serine/threonine protein kinase n=1 Tax=Leersia perrieri TaxID=77586 RepID=A0A0D9XXT6_9ORYZ
MGVSPWIIVFLFSVLLQGFATLADTNIQDTSGLNGIAANWDTKPSNWVGNDPCTDKWIGIICTGNRVTSIRLSSFGMSGTLSGDIQSLSELQYLDLSYNKKLGGSLPPSIGTLTKLQNLILVGCSFTGEIPKEIGQLSNLIFLSLNSNKFTGSIPPSLGSLSKLYWFDLADNQLTGGLPISNGTTPGLDNLTNTKHFHFGINQLSGSIPSQIFSSNMKLIHLLLDNNKFSGSIPSTLGLLKTLEVLRFDSNAQLTGSVPTNLNNLTSLAEFHLANCNLTGPLPDLTGMNSLSFVDMSNNSFSASDVPTWFTTLPPLTSLYLENLRISGEVPQGLFSLSSIQTLRLRGNRLNGTLSIADPSNQLQLVDLRDNAITAVTIGNPFCNQGNSDDARCKATGQSNPALPPYKTASNCAALPPTCHSNQLLSPNCICSVPYRGTLFFRSPGFSDLTNSSYFIQLENTMKTKFLSLSLPVDSISIRDPFVDINNNLEMSLEVYPSGKVQFGEQDISDVAFILSNQTYKPPPTFGPYYFIGQYYSFANGVLQTSKSKKNHLPLIVGVAVGGAAVVAALLALTICITRRKKGSPKQTEDRSQSYVSSWDIKSTSTSTAPQVRGARMFSFDELKKITNNFSEANDIGTGGYGKVYRGTLPTGQLVAVKRSQQGSLQGNLEFRTEIELLSRVHHKNVVSLVGFCFDQGEQMLVYEYVPNGTLKESLTGKSGVRLDWKRRLRVVLGAAKGIAYLHELAEPPIIHRDIKSSNVLLDERLNAKVSDFGLSKLLGEDGRGQITTQVKGTMGYLDPEYYMTQQLTDKSDVYSFGVLLLEVITAKKPLERGRYVVNEVKGAVDRRKDMYGLHELLDPALGASSALAGLEQYIDLALRCVEESGVQRPPMGEVVSEIERIVKMAGAGAPIAESASDSMSYYANRTPRHPYGGDSPSDYSGGGLPSTRVEPK